MIADIIYSLNTESKQSFRLFLLCLWLQAFLWPESRSMQFFVFCCSGVMMADYYVAAAAKYLLGCAVTEWKANKRRILLRYGFPLNSVPVQVQEVRQHRLYVVFLDYGQMSTSSFAVVCVWICFTSCVKQVLPKTQFRRRRQYFFII